jgi:uncharacterized integral membrane protein (TIGR00698 family)
MDTGTPLAAKENDYSWANYLIYMEAGAEMPWPEDQKKHYAVWEGLVLVALMAAAAYGVVASKVFPKGSVEPVTIALPLGLLIGNVFGLPERLRSGVRYAVKSVLTLGIILLGARLNFTDILRVGTTALLMSAAQVMLMLALAALVRRVFGIGSKLATLLGVGTAICGGSAVIAVAPVIGAAEGDVAFAVASVSFLGLATMFLLPIVGHGLGMDPKSFGVWAGLAIHQTPQVVAAGFAYHPVAGQTATLVKLARVCFLAPVALVLGFLQRKDSSAKKKKFGLYDFIPAMVLGFLILACLHSLGLIPAIDFKFPGRTPVGIDLLELCKDLSGIAITMGMAAVGLETSFRSLGNIGLRPLLAGILLALVSVLFSFFAVRWIGL